MGIIFSVFHQSVWYLAGPRMPRSLQISSWFPLYPSRVLVIWLALQPFGGDPGRPDSIVVSAVSHQSAWHLGGQAEGGRGGGVQEFRGSFRLFGEFSGSFYLSGFPGIISAFWEPPEIHFGCLGTNQLTYLRSS